MWMVSFGDAISLLVTFFVMLLAFSEVEDAQLMELIGAMKGGFRITKTEITNLGTSDSSSKVAKQVGFDSASTMVNKGKASKVAATDLLTPQRFAKNSVGNYDKGLFVRLLDQGMSIVVQADGIFQPGSAEFIAKKESVIGIIADFAWSLDNEIRVIGVVPSKIKIQTDAIKTAWGLASLRALVMKDEFVSNMEMEVDRFSLGVTVFDPDDTTFNPVWKQDYMEVIIVGYRDMTRVPEELILQGNWLR